MRTTLTIDDDIAKLVEQEVKRSGDSFKGTVNRLLLQGLMAPKDKAKAKPFVVTPIALGVGEMLDRHNGKVDELLDAIEGPFRR